MARPNILTIITLTKKIQDSAKPINESHKAFDAAMRQFESSARIRALDDDLNKLKALTTLHSKYISRFSNSNEELLAYKLGVNSLSGKECEGALRKMEETKKSLQLIADMSTVIPDIVLAILGKGFIGWKLLEHFSSAKSIDYMVAEQIKTSANANLRNVNLVLQRFDRIRKPVKEVVLIHRRLKTGL